LILLLWQGNVTDAGDTYTIAKFTQPDAAIFAYLLTILTGDESYFQEYYGESMIPTSVEVTIPTATPDGTDGIVEASVDWIGRSGGKISDDAGGSTIGTPDEDSNDYILGCDVTLSLDTTDYTILSGSFTLTNGAVLNPENGSGDGYATGVNLGNMGWGGKLLVYFKEDGAAQILNEALLNKTILNCEVTLATNCTFNVPIGVDSVGQPTDVANGQAVEFSFSPMGSADGSTDVPSAVTIESTGGSTTSPYDGG